MSDVFYVYRFLDEHSNTIYVGRTNNLRKRMNQHFSTNGHLPKGCYKKCKRIEFMRFESESEMKIYELYLINVYNPLFNSIESRNDDFTFSLKEDWTEYKNNGIINCEEMTKKEYNLYSHIVMMSQVGLVNTAITTAEMLANGMGWETVKRSRDKKKVTDLLISMQEKGYLEIEMKGLSLSKSILTIKHTLKDLKFSKEEK